MDRALLRGSYLREDPCAVEDLGFRLVRPLRYRHSGLDEGRGFARDHWPDFFRPRDAGSRSPSRVGECELAIDRPRDLPPTVMQQRVVSAAQQDEVIDVGLAE